MPELRVLPLKPAEDAWNPAQTGRVWFSAKTKQQYYQWVGDTPGIIIQGVSARHPTLHRPRLNAVSHLAEASAAVRSLPGFAFTASLGSIRCCLYPIRRFGDSVGGNRLWRERRIQSATDQPAHGLGAR
jgi:hypothetical protein